MFSSSAVVKQNVRHGVLYCLRTRLTFSFVFVVWSIFDAGSPGFLRFGWRFDSGDVRRQTYAGCLATICTNQPMFVF